MRSRCLLALCTALPACTALAQHQVIVLHDRLFDQSATAASTQALGMGRIPASGFAPAYRWIVGLANSGTQINAAGWSPSAGAFGASQGTPTGYSSSSYQETGGLADVGSAVLAGGVRHALLNSGAPVSLHPVSGWEWTTAWGIGGSGQVGWGMPTGGAIQALLWSGTAASMVNLHPAGFKTSQAYAASGTDQVGEGVINFAPRALRWTGSAASAQNLTPAGYKGAGLRATTGSLLGGFVIPKTGGRQAAVWTVSPAAVAVVHPTGYQNSIIWDMDGTAKAGHGKDSSGLLHALLWLGGINTMYDLNPTLPAGYTDALAYGVDAEGNVAGQAKHFSGKWHAIYWAADRLLSNLVPGSLSNVVATPYAGSLTFSFTEWSLAGELLQFEINRVSLANYPTGQPVPTNQFTNGSTAMVYDTFTQTYSYRLESFLPNGEYTLTVTFANGWRQSFRIRKVA